MWFVQPKQDYVSQIPWKHADEPDVMSWRIRARNYNIFVANILFSVLFFVCLGSAYLMSFGGWSLLSKFLIGGMFLLFFTDHYEHDPPDLYPCLPVYREKC